MWYERDLTGDLPGREARIPIRIALDEPERTIEWLRTRAHDPRELSLALARGHLLARADLGESPIGYVKAGWGEVWVSDFQRCVALPEGAAFIYNSWVDPAHRRQHVASALLAAVMGELQGRGFRRVFCHIAEGNMASRHLYESSGFVARRRICFTRLLGVAVVRPHPRALWSG